MKMKLSTAVLFVMFSTCCLFAYNPPAGGQNLLRISDPVLLTGASSCAGGPVFEVAPSSIVNNPALTALEQRAVINVSGTLLFNSDDNDDKSSGSAFGAAVLIPSRWCVSTFLLQGVFVDFARMQLGNTINGTAGFAKDITDALCVGSYLNTGVFYGHGDDWTLNAAFGGLYQFGDIAFMKNVRFGAAFTNLGKMYNDTKVYGLKPSKTGEWPALVTFRTGVAATLLSKDKFNLGSSLDFAFPAFQNFVCDAGVQLLYGDFIKVSTSWEFDAREFSNEAKNILPSVGVSFKFTFNSKEGSYLASKGWQQSEVTVSSAWKQLYEDINAVSIGTSINLGLKDTQAPEIKLWGEK